MGAVAVIALMVVFFGGTFLISFRIRRRRENADDFMTAGNRIGFGISAASMTATWIWASSMYASASSGYTYGISGPIHYGLWGALMILFIYPFGKRIREVAPKAHTLAEVMYARHGRGSQLMLASSNIVGSLISLMSNFIAGGVLISMLSPFNFVQGVIAIAAGVLLYTLWSGFRASVLTDFIQVMAMLATVVIVVPVIFVAADFPAAFETGAANLTPEQSNFFSSEAFMNQGAPYIAAVLAYAIGNQTIAQRLFAVRKDLIRPTFITATVGYGAMVIGVGMLGVLALYLGFEPTGGNTDNLIPEMAASYLPFALLCLVFVMIIGALASTADSDLSAMSSIVMADVYGQNIAGKQRANPAVMIWVGRITMIAATALAVVFASFEFSILDLLVFVGALWGALVFPVIASFYWKKVTNVGFVVGALAGIAIFIPVRFELFPYGGGFFALAIAVDVLAVLGIGVIFGLMAFGFFGLRTAYIVGVVTAVAAAPFAIGTLHEYATLSGSLVAYSASTILCFFLSFRSKREFDFSVIKERTGDFDTEHRHALGDDPETDETAQAADTVSGPAGARTANSTTKE
ncbi:sodium:proline symporter [Pseudoclavibacter endophyticus]|nr:sodium:proline symporter [Pseudoclavibacter endophyticus]